METIEVQRELVQFLLKRLKECALESAAFRAAVFNFSDEAKQATMKMVEFYGRRTPFDKKWKRDSKN